MNKITLLLISLLFSSVLLSQGAFHNSGNIQIHDQGSIGFHIDVINDGDFNQNRGFTGFYNQNGKITISGSKKPIFNDVEVDVSEDLFLEVSLGINNNIEFTKGLIHTPRDYNNISLDYMNDVPSIGINNNKFVNGYSTMIGNLDFTFPIGDDNRYRPMRIENQTNMGVVRGAYFFEDPNLPNYFSENFETNRFGNSLYSISTSEFWYLEGDTNTKITLTWDEYSNISALTQKLENLRVAGWNTGIKKWVNLGNTNFSGNTRRGEITSDYFIPNDYSVITFSSSDILLDGDLKIFTAVSPNGNGSNDTLLIQGIAKFPENELFIYNRWGNLVYSKKSYNNDWSVLSDGNDLPVGTYFYTLKINGKKDLTGYIYVNK